MAISAAIVINPTTANSLQQVAAALTVSNSGGSAVIVTACVPAVVVNGSSPPQTAGGVALGQPNTGPGQNVTVPAGGTLVISFGLVPMAPNVGTYVNNPFPSNGVGSVPIVPLQPESQPAQQVYSVGAQVYTSDGAVTTSTPAVLTVNSLKVT